MRVNRGRLDLKSLNMEQKCTIVTGACSIILTHMGRSVEMGLYLRGLGSVRPLDDLISIEDGLGKGFPTYWMDLDRLAPYRIYDLTIEARDEDGCPIGLIVDRTPPPERELERPDTRSVIGKLLGRKR